MKQLNPFYWLGVLYASLNYKFNFRRFRRECQRAENLSAEKNGKRFRVFKSKDGSYKALSGDNIRLLHNRKVPGIRTKQDLGLLSKSCLYDTLTHTNLHPVYLNKDLKLKYVETRHTASDRKEDK
jgi:hypothetical protein